MIVFLRKTRRKYYFLKTSKISRVYIVKKGDIQQKRAIFDI